TVTLTAEPSGYTYSWTPTTGLTAPNSQTTDAVVNGTTIYKVTASNGICAKSDTVIIFGEDYVCDNPFVYLPNAFTPNGDGDNDVLYVRSAIAHKVLLRIFNRWGQMVFETESQHVGWDGTFKGRPCDPDVYDYYLKVICVDEQENIMKGNVTLIR
ncbi:MAG TPA: gliding motility-associated C-terminal domain-containing protein, partial [Crocinitomicaceae bacterium]|nr:gliding motility-associated C-terminal domain-containing protein [Crocinitomicaceae bacterium]